MDGYIYAWSIHGSGGLLGKFPVDSVDKGDVVVGAMATDQKDWILVTGDCKGSIKVRRTWHWDWGQLHFFNSACVCLCHEPLSELA